MILTGEKIKGWRGDLAALGAGIMVPFSLAPYKVWLLGLLSAVILAFLLNRLSGKKSFLRSFVYGIGMYGAGASWVYVSIHDFGAASMVLAGLLTFIFVLGMAVVFALPFVVYSKYFSHTNTGLLFGFAAIWVLGEWLRSWLLTGFPWLYLGYAHIETWLSGWAPILGVFGLSFLALLSGVGVAWCAINLRNWRKQKSQIKITSVLLTTAVVAFTVVLWLAGNLLQRVNWTSYDDADQVTVALVQPNIPQDMKWQPIYRMHIMETLRELTADYWGSDIIVWPEAAIPLMYHDAGFFIDENHQQAVESGTALISGILYDSIDEVGQEETKYYNSIMGMGNASGIYFKQRLVPFGEYVPLEQYLRGLIAFFDLPNSVIHSGPKNQNLLSTEKYAIATFICYEVVYPDLVVDYAKQSDIMITISNDAWFGDSIGPKQHFQMAQMRALENGRYMLRGTNTGISAIISEKGQVLTKLPPFNQISAQGKAYLTHGTTPFAKFGSLPIIMFCFSICLALFVKNKLGRSQRFSEKEFLEK